jgi:hypothetical protein
MPSELITHAVATDRIAAHYADRTAFIILAGLNLDLQVANRLSALPAWTAYAVDASGLVLATDDLNLLTARSILAGLAGVPSITLFTVPKAVPAVDLGEALGQHVAEDGSRDVITCTVPGEPIAWPMVFVEALRRVDPAAAMSLEANDLARMS